MKRFTFSILTSFLVLSACTDDDGADGDTNAATEAGDGDHGDAEHGDGDHGDGDGDGEHGDGDGEHGDGDGEHDNCASIHETCDGLKAAFTAETGVVTQCTHDADCGQVLAGTSCGCTQDWVANLDADTTCFYAIIAQAEALQCELILASTCDCPEADGFKCNGGSCSWNYL